MIKATGRTHKIQVQRLTASQDPDTNEEVRAWSPVLTALAGKGYRRASEGQAVAEIAAIRVLRFDLPWSPAADTITPLDRIEYPVGASTFFDITEVNEIGRREGVEIFAAARSDGGKA